MNHHSFHGMTAPDKRDRILNAATKVFAKHGFFASQVADVAKSAGVAAGTVYLYFKSKDDLLLSLFERTMRDAITEGRAALEQLERLDQPVTPIERLRHIAHVHLARLGRDRHLAVVFQVELRQSTKFMARLSSSSLRDYLGLLRDVIVDGQRDGQFRADINPTLAAKVIFGALDEMATNWILSERDYALEDDAEPVMTLLLGGLQVKEAKRQRGKEANHRESKIGNRQSLIGN
jgi:TetR/AcrR family fatty acid metabolism transcriptional regulator